MGDVTDSIRKLTGTQLRAFERIVVNLDQGVRPKIAATLLELGLIEEYEEALPGWPPVTLTRYCVPLPVRMESCRICAHPTKLPKARQRKR